MRKRIVATILCITMVMAGLAGCKGADKAGSNEAAGGEAAGNEAAGSNEEAKAPETSENGEKTELTITGIGFDIDGGINVTTGEEYMGWNEWKETYFEKEFPNVELKIETIPWDGFRAKMLTILQSGSTDILYASGSFVADYYEQGYLAGLNELMENDDEFVFEDVYPAGLKTNMNLTDYSNKELVALPYILGYRINVYDKQIFDDWGVEYLSDHPTIEEIIEKASQMTGINPVTGQQNYGVWWSCKAPNMSTLVNIGYQNGIVGCEGSLGDLANLKWSLNSPEVEKSVTQLAELSKYATPGYVSEETPSTVGPDNNVAIFLDTSGSPFMTAYKGYGDEMLERFVPVKGLGSQGEGWAVADGLAMSTSIAPEKKEIAWEVMKYIAGNEASKWYFEQFGPLTMAVNDESFYDPEDKYVIANRASIENSHSGLFEELNPFFASDIQPTLSALITNVASGQNIDIKAELDSLQKRAEEWSASQ